MKNQNIGKTSDVNCNGVLNKSDKMSFVQLAKYNIAAAKIKIESFAARAKYKKKRLLAENRGSNSTVGLVSTSIGMMAIMDDTTSIGGLVAGAVLLAIGTECIKARRRNGILDTLVKKMTEEKTK